MLIGSAIVCAIIRALKIYDVIVFTLSPCMHIVEQFIGSLFDCSARRCDANFRL